MKRAPLILIALFFLYSVSCAQPDKSSIKSPSQEELSKPRAHFKNQFEDAEKYWTLIKAGKEYREQGKLKDALGSFKEALNNHAAMRNEKATASDQIAITYEMMGNFEEAAKYYDLASEVTMNENRKTSLSLKAKALYQKSRVNRTTSQGKG